MNCKDDCSTSVNTLVLVVNTLVAMGEKVPKNVKNVKFDPGGQHKA